MYLRAQGFQVVGVDFASAAPCERSTGPCGRAVGKRTDHPLLPAFLDFTVDEFSLEMADQEFAETELLGQIAEHKDIAVGVVDVKNYHIETPEEAAERVRLCLEHAPAERLAFSPDCGLSQTARWAAKQKLANLVRGVELVRQELDL